MSALHALAQCFALVMALYCLVMSLLHRKEEPASWSLTALWWLVLSMTLGRL